MIANALIVFREVLEASLVVGLVLAASKGTPRRGRWVLAGIVTGIVGATIVAAFAGEIAAVVEGVGQDLFNAAVLFAAVAMLGWHNVWMGRHGKEMAIEAASIGRAVLAGARPLYALAFAVGLAVLREGSELVLFLYGLAAAGNGSVSDLVGGILIGVASGAAFGVALYAGLLRIPTRHLFTVTSWMILLLAAGMAAQGAAFLVQADVLPPLGNRLWDTSALLSEDQIAGQVLHALVGYVSQPSGIQLVFYIATVALIGLLMRRFGGGPPSVMRVAAMALVLWGAAAALSAARADIQVRSPLGDHRRIEAVTFGEKDSVTFTLPPERSVPE